MIRIGMVTSDAGPRTGRADIEQHAARTRHRSHPNEGAESSDDEEWTGRAPG